MGLIKEWVLEDGIRIMQKTDCISYQDIQNCLNRAHSVNKKKDLLYATQNQTVEKLKEKLKDSVTYVALSPDGAVVATASIQFRKINYWYHCGDIGLLKLVGVLPEYSGRKLALLLLHMIIIETKLHNVDVLVSDSAEENIAIRNLYMNNGFKIVDCCKYTTNNFISVVYAYWFHGCPYTDEILEKHYLEHRKDLLI